MPLTPNDMLKIVFEKLQARTGKDFAAWVEIARADGPSTHKALTGWLKATHGLNHNEAQWVAWGVTDPGRADAYDRPADLVAELYADKKSALRPTYDALMSMGLGLGPDVTSFVCKTYSSLSSGTQFAIFAPRTNSAIDVELVLPEGHGLAGVEPFKSSNPKFTARMRLRVGDPVGEHVRAALAAARTRVRGG